MSRLTRRLSWIGGITILLVGSFYFFLVFGGSLLLIAVEMDSPALAKISLKLGADPKYEHSHFPVGYFTSLDRAIEKNELAITELIYDHEPSLEQGTLALHHAAAFGRTEILRMLLAKGVYPNSRTPYGDNALHTLIRSNDYGAAFGRDKLPALELLLKAGVDIEAREYPNQTQIEKGFLDTGTPLYSAVYEDKLELVQMLLQYGANPNTVVHGKTILEYAYDKEKGRSHLGPPSEMVRILENKAKGRDLDYQPLCQIPEGYENAKIIYLHVGAGGELARTPLSTESETTISRITIQESDKPLYVIVSSGTDVVWKVKGKLENLAKLVVIKNPRRPIAAPDVPADKFELLPEYHCFASPLNLDAETGRMASEGAIKSILKGHEIQAINLRRAAEIDLPSGNYSISSIPDYIPGTKEPTAQETNGSFWWADPAKKRHHYRFR